MTDESSHSPLLDTVFFGSQAAGANDEHLRNSLGQLLGDQTQPHHQLLLRLCRNQPIRQVQAPPLGSWNRIMSQQASCLSSEIALHVGSRVCLMSSADHAAD